MINPASALFNLKSSIPSPQMGEVPTPEQQVAEFFIIPDKNNINLIDQFLNGDGELEILIPKITHQFKFQQHLLSFFINHNQKSEFSETFKTLGISYFILCWSLDIEYLRLEEEAMTILDFLHKIHVQDANLISILHYFFKLFLKACMLPVNFLWTPGFVHNALSYISNTKTLPSSIFQTLFQFFFAIDERCTSGPAKEMMSTLNFLINEKRNCIKMDNVKDILIIYHELITSFDSTALQITALLTQINRNLDCLLDVYFLLGNTLAAFLAGIGVELTSPSEIIKSSQKLQLQDPNFNSKNGNIDFDHLPKFPDLTAYFHQTFESNYNDQLLQLQKDIKPIQFHTLLINNVKDILSKLSNCLTSSSSEYRIAFFNTLLTYSKAFIKTSQIYLFAEVLLHFLENVCIESETQPIFDVLLSTEITSPEINFFSNNLPDEIKYFRMKLFEIIRLKFPTLLSSYLNVSIKSINIFRAYLFCENAIRFSEYPNTFQYIAVDDVLNFAAKINNFNMNENAQLSLYCFMWNLIMNPKSQTIVIKNQLFTQMFFRFLFNDYYSVITFDVFKKILTNLSSFSNVILFLESFFIQDTIDSSWQEFQLQITNTILNALQTNPQFLKFLSSYNNNGIPFISIIFETKKYFLLNTTLNIMKFINMERPLNSNQIDILSDYVRQSFLLLFHSQDQIDQQSKLVLSIFWNMLARSNLILNTASLMIDAPLIIDLILKVFWDSDYIGIIVDKLDSLRRFSIVNRIALSNSNFVSFILNQDNFQRIKPEFKSSIISFVFKLIGFSCSYLDCSLIIQHLNDPQFESSVLKIIPYLPTDTYILGLIDKCFSIDGFKLYLIPASSELDQLLNVSFDLFVDFQAGSYSNSSYVLFGITDSINHKTLNFVLAKRTIILEIIDGSYLSRQLLSSAVPFNEWKNYTFNFVFNPEKNQITIKTLIGGKRSSSDGNVKFCFDPRSILSIFFGGISNMMPISEPLIWVGKPHALMKFIRIGILIGEQQQTFEKFLFNSNEFNNSIASISDSHKQVTLNPPYTFDLKGNRCYLTQFQRYFSYFSNEIASNFASPDFQSKSTFQQAKDIFTLLGYSFRVYGESEKIQNNFSLIPQISSYLINHPDFATFEMMNTLFNIFNFLPSENISKIRSEWIKKIILNIDYWFSKQNQQNNSLCEKLMIFYLSNVLPQAHTVFQQDSFLLTLFESSLIFNPIFEKFATRAICLNLKANDITALFSNISKRIGFEKILPNSENEMDDNFDDLELSDEQNTELHEKILSLKIFNKVLQIFENIPNEAFQDCVQSDVPMNCLLLRLNSYNIKSILLVIHKLKPPYIHDYYVATARIIQNSRTMNPLNDKFISPYENAKLTEIEMKGLISSLIPILPQYPNLSTFLCCIDMKIAYGPLVDSLNSIKDWSSYTFSPVWYIIPMIFIFKIQQENLSFEFLSHMLLYSPSFSQDYKRIVHFASFLHDSASFSLNFISLLNSYLLQNEIDDQKKRIIANYVIPFILFRITPPSQISSTLNREKPEDFNKKNSNDNTFIPQTKPRSQTQFTKVEEFSLSIYLEKTDNLVNFNNLNDLVSLWNSGWGDIQNNIQSCLRVNDDGSWADEQFVRTSLSQLIFTDDTQDFLNFLLTNIPENITGDFQLGEFSKYFMSIIDTNAKAISSDILILKTESLAFSTHIQVILNILTPEMIAEISNTSSLTTPFSLMQYSFNSAIPLLSNDVWNKSNLHQKFSLMFRSSRLSASGFPLYLKKVSQDILDQQNPNSTQSSDQNMNSVKLIENHLLSQFPEPLASIFCQRIKPHSTKLQRLFIFKDCFILNGKLIMFSEISGITRPSLQNRVQSTKSNETSSFEELIEIYRKDGRTYLLDLGNSAKVVIPQIPQSLMTVSRVSAETVVSKWAAGSLSNFELIVQLNLIYGRSFNSEKLSLIAPNINDPNLGEQNLDDLLLPLPNSDLQKIEAQKTLSSENKNPQTVYELRKKFECQKVTQTIPQWVKDHLQSPAGLFSKFISTHAPAYNPKIVEWEAQCIECVGSDCNGVLVKSENNIEIVALHQNGVVTRRTFDDLKEVNDKRILGSLKRCPQEDEIIRINNGILAVFSRQEHSIILINRSSVKPPYRLDSLTNMIEISRKVVAFCPDFCTVALIELGNDLEKKSSYEIIHTTKKIKNMSIQDASKVIGILTEDNTLQIYDYRNGKIISEISLDNSKDKNNDQPAHMIITEKWGFVVIVYCGEIFLYDENLNLIKKTQFNQKIRKLFSLASKGIDYVAIETQENTLYVFEAFFPEKIGNSFGIGAIICDLALVENHKSVLVLTQTGIITLVPANFL